MALALPADWSPRTFRAGDEEGILRLLQSAFQPWPRAELTVAPIEHLRWKLSSSDVALRHHRIADVNGEIAGVAEVQCWCTANHPYCALLDDAGFSQKRRTVAITFQTTRPGVEGLLAPVRAPGAVVHFMLGDSDLI